MTDQGPHIQVRGASADTPTERWERQRAMGRRAFVWRYGVLGWGLPAALLTIAYAFIKEQGFSWSAASASPKLRAGVVITLVIFPALGHMFGGRLWDARERERDERGQR
jgi:hypothetical protein